MASVLIVDDEDLSRHSVRKLLGRLFPGVTVSGEACNGREAVEMAQALAPDIVLMDIKIPTINGLDAAAMIRESAPATAIIILSAYDNFSFAQRALNMGLEGYLLKPVREDEFAAVFGAAISRAASPNPGFSDLPDKNGSVASHSGLRTRIETAIAGCPLPELGLDAVADRLGMSAQHLSRLFKEVFGMKFVEYAAKRKIEAAARIFETEDLTIDELGKRLGWTDPGHLSRMFKDHTGLTPKAFARLVRNRTGNPPEGDR